MTEILRYVKPNSSEVEESFLDFFTVSNKTGEGLTQEILEKVEKDGLDIKIVEDSPMIMEPTWLGRGRG